MYKFLVNLTICAAVIFSMIETARAQTAKPGLTFGGYLKYSKPKGNFENAYKFGGGGEVFGGIGVGKTYIIATAGLSKFKAHSNSHSGTLTYVPVKIGLKQFLFGKLLFVNADLGKATVKNRKFNESSFTRGIGVGARLLGLEAAIYYDGWKNVNARGFSNSLNVKVGWSLSL